MANNKLAKTKRKEVSPFREFGDTLKDQDQLGAVMPRYFFKGDQGHYKHSLSEEVKERLQCVILGGKGSRVYFAKKYDPKNLESPACRSYDGIKPVPPGIVETCADCQFSKWGPDNEPPACWQCYDLLCLELPNDNPFIITFKRTALSPLKRYVSLLKSEGRPPWSVITEMDSIKNENYFVPVFSTARQLELNEAKPYYEIYQKLVGQFSEAAPEFDEENGEEEESPAL